MERTNAGYTILSSLKVTKEKEIVLGKNKTSHYVTWEYTVSRQDYCFGHYYDNELSAMSDYASRITKEIEFLQELQEDKRRHFDIDADGIPDFIDAQYTTEDDKYMYQRMDKEELAKLDQYAVPYEATEKDNSYIVRYTEQYAEVVESILEGSVSQHI